MLTCTSRACYVFVAITQLLQLTEFWVITWQCDRVVGTIKRLRNNEVADNEIRSSLHCSIVQLGSLVTNQSCVYPSHSEQALVLQVLERGTQSPRVVLHEHDIGLWCDVCIGVGADEQPRKGWAALQGWLVCLSELRVDTCTELEE